MAQSQARLLISGQVQGVGYRFWTVRQAKQLGLNGWVRNLPDGRVEALFEGDCQLVSEMIEKCHTGPGAALVTNITINEGAPSGKTGV